MIKRKTTILIHIGEKELISTIHSVKENEYINILHLKVRVNIHDHAVIPILYHVDYNILYT